ncbi:MAG: hypothetical protein IJS09_00485 [Treponema sp.]|nr:hypothetical protein [Treponema sp.]
MPGLSQLRQFSEDIKNLGDEVQIRRMRGEKPVFLPVPDVPDVDDSNDFMLGLPDPNEKDEAPAPTASVDMSATEDIDLSSLGIPGFDSGNSSAPAAPEAPVDIPPELASILGPVADTSSASDVEMPDLSDFLDEPVSSAPSSVPDVPVSDIPVPDVPATEEPAPDAFAETPAFDSSAAETSLDSEPSDALSGMGDLPDLGDLGDLSDMGDFSSLVTPPDEDASKEGLQENADAQGEDALSSDSVELPNDLSLPDGFGENEDLEVPDGIPSMDELLPEENGENPIAIDQAALDALFNKPNEPIKSEPVSDANEESVASDTADVSADAAVSEDISNDVSDDVTAPDVTSASDDSSLSLDDLSLPDDFGFTGEEIDMGSEAPAPEAIASQSKKTAPSAEPASDEAASSSDNLSLDDFSMDSLPPLDDFDSLGGSTGADSLGTTDSGSDALGDDFSMDTATADALPADTSTSSEPAGETSGTASDSLGGDIDDLASMFDTSGLDFPDGMGSAPTGEAPDVSMDVPQEIFDTSEMDGLDFSSDDLGSSGSTALPFDTDFPVTGEGGGDDFELTDDFEIPGFSDADSAPDDKKGGFRLDSPDFSKANADRPPNTLSEEEYEKFKKNLAGYPLNLRIAVEDFIVKDEFKDDVIFEVVEKVLKKVSARQLAGHLEKLLDISIDVPRDFERRSVAEYEAYKQSFQYQLKNRILPMAVAGVMLTIVGFFLFHAGKRFVYQPVMASRLYNQGYTMLENNEFPQSEELFQRAVSYKPVKKWFFRYAKGYREHKQFERAAQMYRNILGLFNYDKQAGLEYARMELYERANYARAEEIVRRSVLDHYINDSAGILLLGDIFLEWAEIDPEKYELARLEYSNLIQLYGGTDLYMSRMMRYFIRTDNLPNVLSLKTRFYSNKKSLGAEDWTELSGYLLDKLYGKLSKTEESLRSSIEDVLDMLETAVKLDPVNPVARYNLSRYFLHNNNDVSARREMKIALDLFERAPVRTRKNTYREINGNRVLGELFARDREYIKAQESYTKGINVYTEEHDKTGLEGDENTGKLYADMGDLDYFITGDMDAALSNYQTAIGMKNDTPSLNYRVGAIHYNKKDYDKALGSFIKTSETRGSDSSLLLSLGNTLSLRGDNFAAQGYYSDLITRLNNDRARRVIFNPHHDDDDNALLDMFVKANNNLGVTLYRLARQTGDSAKNAEALVRLSDSMRAWDAYTRNPETMKRLEGSNLASQNSKYITHPYPDFEPAIYTDIPKTLDGEATLE